MKKAIFTFFTIVLLFFSIARLDLIERQLDSGVGRYTQEFREFFKSWKENACLTGEQPKRRAV